MLSEKVFSKEAYYLEINKPEDVFYYKFDYDTRSFNVNMEFQHFHDFYELFILMDEGVGHIIEGEYYDLQYFDIVALKPNVLHKTYYLEGAPKKRLIINFRVQEVLKDLDKEFKELLSIFEEGFVIYRFNEHQRQDIAKLLKQIFTIDEENSNLKKMLIHHKFTELIYFIYKFKNKNTYKPEATLDTTTHKIYSITSFIHTSYASELSLDLIAKKFFISPYYLSHQFKKITGFNLVNYIQMTRIRNAQQMLLNTDLKITVIAQACGFTSFSQFNRVFNKFCKLSPSQFRMKENTTHL